MTRLFSCKLVDDSLYEQFKPRLLKKVPQTCAMKALSYHHASDSQRHLTGELLARHALEILTGIRPRDPFLQGEKGKPHPEGYLGVHFNVTHSGSWVVVATSDVPVGVDVEKIRKVPEGVAYRFFSEPEKELLLNANTEELKADIFFTLWTLKESFLKAIGKGLTKSLSTFTVLKQSNGDYTLSPAPETNGYFLKNYPFEKGYKLSACAASNFFIPEVTIIALDKLAE
jgi:4'-phosphopantetheinyl transferase